MNPMTRESITAVIRSTVAEKALCWCDGRRKRVRDMGVNDHCLWKRAVWK